MNNCLCFQKKPKNKSNFAGLHHLPPLEIAEHCDDDIQSIKTGLEGDVLVEIQDTGDDIHHNPDEPLFQVLTR